MEYKAKYRQVNTVRMIHYTVLNSILKNIKLLEKYLVIITAYNQLLLLPNLLVIYLCDDV